MLSKLSCRSVNPIYGCLGPFFFCILIYLLVVEWGEPSIHQPVEKKEKNDIYAPECNTKYWETNRLQVLFLGYSYRSGRERRGEEKKRKKKKKKEEEEEEFHLR